MKKVMILSGAGLSAPSGLKTFRDNGGLWEDYDVMEVCSESGFRRDRKKVLDFYDKRRKELAKAQPNHAHEQIARLQQRWGANLSVLTQNVDDLLERTGCKEVLHLHGKLRELRCLECGATLDIGYEGIEGQSCARCGSENLRHNIVMFEEEAPAYATLYALLASTELFISIGTSGAVLPVGVFASACRQSILNIAEDDRRLARHFTKVYIEDVLSAIDKIADDIERFMLTGETGGGS